MKSPSSDELTNSLAAYFVMKSEDVRAFSVCYSKMIYNLVFNYGYWSCEAQEFG